jgi:Domain of unknown function (DUF4145)
MRSVPISSIVAWCEHTDHALPGRINSTCGVCSKDFSLDVSAGHYHEHDTWLAAVQCPNPLCRAVLRYFGFEMQGRQFTRLYVDPSYEDGRAAMPGIELAPERVQKAYADTLATLNSGISSAVATLARKTLEGIIKLSYPNPEGIKDRSLFKLIRDLPQNKDLGKPIMELSYAMREGGNLSAHFDLEKDTDAESAEKMVELLESLIEYLYVIPSRVDALKRDFE